MKKKENKNREEKKYRINVRKRKITFTKCEVALAPTLPPLPAPTIGGTVKRKVIVAFNQLAEIKISL